LIYIAKNPQNTYYAFADNKDILRNILTNIYLIFNNVMFRMQIIPGTDFAHTTDFYVLRILNVIFKKLWRGNNGYVLSEIRH
jgi:hypothetical protein